LAELNTSIEITKSNSCHKVFF